MDRFRTDNHPDVEAAKEQRDQAEEAMRAARAKAETLIHKAKTLREQATTAAKDGRDEEAEQLLDDAMEAKRTAEKKAAIADARSEMAAQAEQEFRATIEKAKEELREEARAERGEKLQEALDVYEDFAEKMEAAREIDSVYAGLVGSSAAKAIPKLRVNGVRGTTSTLDRYMERVRKVAESDVARAAA